MGKVRLLNLSFIMYCSCLQLFQTFQVCVFCIKIVSGGLCLPPSAANNTSFLLAAHPRTRSKSDTALGPPTWDADFIQQQQQLQERRALSLDLELQQQQEDGGTVNMNDILPGSQTYASSSHQ